MSSTKKLADQRGHRRHQEDCPDDDAERRRDREDPGEDGERHVGEWSE